MLTRLSILIAVLGHLAGATLCAAICCDAMGRAGSVDACCPVEASAPVVCEVAPTADSCCAEPEPAPCDDPAPAPHQCPSKCCELTVPIHPDPVVVDPVVVWTPALALLPLGRPMVSTAPTRPMACFATGPPDGSDVHERLARMCVWVI